MELELAYRPTEKQLAFHASTAERCSMAGRRAAERATPSAGMR